MKVMFLVNGLGLGNSTRCHAIMQHLHGADVQIDVVTSGNGLWYFSDKAEPAAVHEIEALAYGAKQGDISIFRTFASAGKMASTLRSNAKKIARLLDDIKPDVVVTDSDYNFVPIKRRKIPIAALNNADVVWHSYFLFKNPPPSIRPQFYGVEMLDYRFHQCVPDLVLSPSLDPAIPESGGKITRIGPIVRRGYDPVPWGAAVTRAAVMLSGSVFGTPVNFNRDNYPVHIDVIGRTAPPGWRDRPEVTFHGKIKNTYAILKKADIAVVNGGFSAVSELFWMQKPLVVVPVPNHAEQWVNARTIERLGLGLMATQDTYEETMFEAIARIEDFRQAYRRLGKMTDGAAEAAGAIRKLAGRKI